ncbi:MAG: flagellar biosynthetic protein FliO [Comamonas sp.]
MWPTLVLVALFVAAMAALPWLVRRLQQKNLLPRGMGMTRGAAPLPLQILGSLSIGQQQRVVTVQVGDGDEAVRLVLGVTAQQIQCLHVLEEHKAHAPAAIKSEASQFADVMAQAQRQASQDQGHV